MTSAATADMYHVLVAHVINDAVDTTAIKEHHVVEVEIGMFLHKLNALATAYKKTFQHPNETAEVDEDFFRNLVAVSEFSRFVSFDANNVKVEVTPQKFQAQLTGILVDSSIRYSKTLAREVDDLTEKYLEVRPPVPRISVAMETKLDPETEDDRKESAEDVVDDRVEDESAAMDLDTEETGKLETGKPETGKPETGKPETGRPETEEDTAEAETAEPETAEPEEIEETAEPETAEPEETGEPESAEPEEEETAEPDETEEKPTDDTPEEDAQDVPEVPLQTPRVPLETPEVKEEERHPSKPPKVHPPTETASPEPQAKSAPKPLTPLVDGSERPPKRSVSPLVASQKHKRFQNIAINLVKTIEEHRFSSPFLVPVLADEYADVVYYPKDLKSILKAIKRKSEPAPYETIKELERDIMLMFANCVMYNKSSAHLVDMAKQMRDDVRNTFKMFEEAESDIA